MRVTVRAVRRVALTTHLAALILCAWLAFGPKPAVQAQSAEDRVQDTKIQQIDQHLSSSDATVDRLWTQVNAQGNAISEMQGEERIFFAILTLLTGGNFVFQVKRK